MKSTSSWVGIVMLAALSGCGGEDDASNGAPTSSVGGSMTTGGGSGGGTGDTTGTATESVTGGTDSSTIGTTGGGSGGFTVDAGVCRANAMPGPEPIYEVDSTFGYMGSMAAHGDTLYFAESADFDDIPPRIAKLDGAGPPTTLVEGARASQLHVFGDTLYYVDSDTDELKSVDLATDNAAPTVLNTAPGIVLYDEEHVVYKDETNIYAVDVGAPDLSGAVTLYPAEDISSYAIAGDTLYLSSSEGVYRVGLDGTGAMDVVPDDSFNSIHLIASDGTTLYFDNFNVLGAVPVTGAEPLSIGLAGPGLFDTAGFYWLHPAGNVIYWADDAESYGWTAVDGMSCGILGTHDGFERGGGALADNYFYASGQATIYRVDRPD